MKSIEQQFYFKNIDKLILLCYNYFVVKGKINNLTENKKTNIKEKIL